MCCRAVGRMSVCDFRLRYSLIMTAGQSLLDCPARHLLYSRLPGLFHFASHRYPLRWYSRQHCLQPRDPSGSVLISLHQTCQPSFRREGWRAPYARWNSVCRHLVLEIPSSAFQLRQPPRMIASLHSSLRGSAVGPAGMSHWIDDFLGNVGIGCRDEGQSWVSVGVVGGRWIVFCLSPCFGGHFFACFCDHGASSFDHDSWAVWAEVDGTLFPPVASEAT